MKSQPKLDLSVLQQRSAALEQLLKEHAPAEAAARACLSELSPIFEEVAQGLIMEPRAEPPPCGYHFHEGSLRKYPALEEAFSEFSMALQGWDANSLKDMLKTLKHV